MRFTCSRCGVYDICYGFMATAKGNDVLTAEMRLRLSHVIRKATDSSGYFGEEVLDVPTCERLAERHPLPDAVDQADILVDSIARRSSYGEWTPSEKVDAWAARLGLKGVAQLRDIHRELEPLVKQSGLSSMAAAVSESAIAVSFGLTLEGWKRAREIRRERGPGNQAFVAMWFHPGLLSAYTDGFAPALTDTGHQPFRVDFAAHNNKVDDQIVAEIRRSKLVIVDATGARPNAYWEAGFAMGLGIPLLWCCNDSWDAHVQAVVPHGPASSGPVVTKWSGPDVLAFDTRQHAFTFWSDPADLKEKLTARIRALGFDAEWNRQR
jgi:hypothetical protein